MYGLLLNWWQFKNIELELKLQNVLFFTEYGLEFKTELSHSQLKSYICLIYRNSIGFLKILHTCIKNTTIYIP